MPTAPLSFAAWLLVVALVTARGASAQGWDEPWDDPMDRPPRVDISASAGFLAPTDWSDLVLLGTISPAFGVLEQVLVQDVRVEPDSKFAAGATYWRGRYGVRADVGYSRSRLTVGGAPFRAEGDLVDVRTWMYGVRGMVGLVEYHPRRWLWPYGFVGFGGITYDLARPVAPPLLTFIEHGGAASGGDSDLVVVGDGREFVLGINQLDLETVPAFSFGLGADIRVPAGPTGLGLRFEVGDTVAQSPVRVRIREVGVPGSETDLGLGRVHHLRVSAGVVLRIGR